MIRIFGFVVLAGTLVFSGCSSKVEESTDQDFAAAGERAARAANLTVSDVPPDWTAFDDDAEDAEASHAPPLGGECSLLDEPDQGFRGQVAWADSDSYSGPTQEVNTEASVFSTEDEAMSSLTAWIETFDRCQPQVVAAAAEKGSDFSYSTITALIGTHELPGFRIELATTESQPAGTVDVIFVQTGRVVASLIYGGNRPNDGDRDYFVALLLNKAEQAENGLK